jgi:hypothetical protein
MNHTCICQRRHTALVVSLGIHVVYTDSVGSQFGHARNIAFALGSVNKWVTRGKLISNAYGSQSTLSEE